MRASWALCALLLAIVFVPLFINVLWPNISFLFYLYNLPVDSDDPHVKDSMDSMRSLTLVTFCLFPIVAALPVVCPFVTDPASLPKHTNVTLHSMTQYQHTVFTELIRYAPPPGMISALSSLAHEGNTEGIQGHRDSQNVGEDVSSLDPSIGNSGPELYVRQMSALTAQHLYGVLTHIELTICRAYFMHNLILSVLTPLNRYEGGHMSLKTPVIERLLALSAEATANSFAHLRHEIQASLDTATMLLTALRVSVERNVEPVQCEPSLLASVIPEILTLSPDYVTIVSAIECLGDLQDETLSSLDDFVSYPPPINYPFVLFFPIIRLHENTLSRQLLIVQHQRKLGSASLHDG